MTAQDEAVGGVLGKLPLSYAESLGGEVMRQRAFKRISSAAAPRLQ